ncbi:radical SAM/SPASM domain-containing protein [Burkholderia pseudomallei]|uniref:radical SAM/SPASM domain-containing protein n=1 Tax=Burkholderia pseudomallei TaxID=28450 RepID=UPI0009B53D74|nr:radical SAM protein [Burkholderia pseudomallei]NAX51847.1 radical SAM protein [Burkholderia pseudomallei]NAX72002.1 radical SAM protein [Burkholderia pseudomallei]NAY57741.1 radical SAM protein [Burkholderia pseudomallei]NAY64062.1 radical SAM protein [Burkholderia pseudomallei]NAY70827.1 radical SAM protein [Burkholderia pseudomallei]
MSEQLLEMAESRQCCSKPKVKYLHIDVTVICNLKCTYCYYGDYNNKVSKEKEVSLEKLKETILDAKILGCTRVIFSGGEVYTSDKFEPLLFFCAENNLEVTIITNGTLAKRSNVANLLRIRKHLHEVKVSFDGVNHDKIRGKGSTTHTLDFIEELNACGLPWTLNTIITKLNLPGLKDLYNFLLKRSPKSWRIDHPFLQGRYVKSQGKLALDSLESAFVQLAEILSQYLCDKPNFELWMFTIYRPGLEDWAFTKQDLHMHPCTYNKRNIAVRGNGEITPCSRFLHPMGNIATSSLSSVRKEKGFSDYWNIRIGDLQDCRNCKYLYACGGGCRAHAQYETGDLMSNDPIACQIMPLFERYILPLFSQSTRDSFEILVREAEAQGMAGLPKDWRTRKTIYMQLMEE